MMFPSFSRRPARPEAEALKRSLRAHLGLSDDDCLAVNEIDCPACGPDGIETVVLVMREGLPTAVLKYPRTMAELAAEPSLLAELGAEPDLHGSPRR